MTEQQPTPLQQAADNYIGHPFEIDEDSTISARRQSFMDGANWQRNHVWHDASEKSEPNKDVLMVTLRTGLYMAVNSSSWIFKNTPCDKWAYLSDLLPQND